MKRQESSRAGSWIVAMVIGVAIMVGLVLVLLVLAHQAERQRHRVYQTNPSVLLEACRTLIAEKGTYRHDDARLAVRTDPGTVVLDPSIAPLETNVPSVIRDLNPKLVIIESNKVTVCLWTLPARFVLGFAEGAEEYGSERLTNGLWLWYGD